MKLRSVSSTQRCTPSGLALDSLAAGLSLLVRTSGHLATGETWGVEGRKNTHAADAVARTAASTRSNSSMSADGKRPSGPRGERSVKGDS